MSAFFSLNRTDLWKGLAVAVLVAFFGAAQQALSGHGLDVATYDWPGILNVIWMAAAGYLSKNLLTTSKGNIAGLIPTK
jgi:hypothetical protein